MSVRYTNLFARLQPSGTLLWVSLVSALLLCTALFFPTTVFSFSQSTHKALEFKRLDSPVFISSTHTERTCFDEFLENENVEKNEDDSKERDLKSPLLSIFVVSSPISYHIEARKNLVLAAALPVLLPYNPCDCIVAKPFYILYRQFKARIV